MAAAPPPQAAPALFYAVAVVELPALRHLSSYPPQSAQDLKVHGPFPPEARPRKVCMFGSPSFNASRQEQEEYRAQKARDPGFSGRRPSFNFDVEGAVLKSCFPDLDHLLRTPYSYEHVADEYVNYIDTEQKVQPYVLYGFCRRYRIGGADTAHRLDLPPSTASGSGSDPSPSFQCICILSEQCVRELQHPAGLLTFLLSLSHTHTHMHTPHTHASHPLLLTTSAPAVPTSASSPRPCSSSMQRAWLAVRLPSASSAPS